MPPIKKQQLTINLRLPQLRMLQVLSKGTPYLTRAKLAERCGFSAISSTAWRALNGIREGSSSGAARPGLIQMGYVDKQDLDIEGVVETVYFITDEGRKVFEEHIKLSGPLPEQLRSKEVSTNKRYQEDHDDEEDE